jgi:hypothetical protein
MSAAAHADHRIFDCRYCGLRTGRDGACPDRRRMRRRSAHQHPSDVTVAVAIALGRRIVSPGLPAPCLPRRRSEPAAPIATAQSP